MGTNGIPAIDALREREKCPEAPTKRKYRTRALAESAAKERSAETKLPIIAYACSGCGYFHLSKKANGSDVVHDDGKAIVTPGMRTRLRVVDKPPTERNWEVFPRVAGNAAAREKMFREFIDVNPGPLAVATVMEALNCGKESARDVMKRAGYTAKRGPGAKWAPPSDAPVDEQSTDDDWRTPTSLPSHISIDDYVRAMKGVGLVVRIQVRAEA